MARRARQLGGARLKIARAQEHLVALKQGIKRLGEPNSYTIRAEPSLNAREYLLRLVVLKRPPLAEWGAITGDVVHNLRAALDHVVWQLTTFRQGSAPTPRLPEPWRGIEFPIFKDRDLFLSGKKGKTTKDFANSRSGLYKIRSIDPSLCAEFERLQPFNGGQRRARQHLLWILRELDVIDKHRTIPVVTTWVRANAMDVRSYEELFPGLVAHGFPQPHIDVIKVFDRGPLKNNAPLAVIRQHGRWNITPYALPMHMDPTVSVNVTFKKGPPAWGVDLLLNLEAMYKKVEEVVAIFDSAFTRSP